MVEFPWRTLWGFDKDVLKHSDVAEVFVCSETNLSAAWLQADKVFYLGIWVTLKKKECCIRKTVFLCQSVCLFLIPALRLQVPLGCFPLMETFEID